MTRMPVIALVALSLILFLSGEKEFLWRVPFQPYQCLFVPDIHHSCTLVHDHQKRVFFSDIHIFTKTSSSCSHWRYMHFRRIDGVRRVLTEDIVKETSTRKKLHIITSDCKDKPLESWARAWVKIRREQKKNGGLLESLLPYLHIKACTIWACAPR